MSKISELEQKMKNLTREAFQLEEFGQAVAAEARLAEAKRIWEQIAKLAREGH